MYSDDDSVELQLVYYIKEEILDAEQIEKIIWNDRINEALERYGKCNPSVDLLGLYGTIEIVIKFLEEITSCRISVNDEINTYDQRGLICICCNNSNIYLCFICSDEYFTKSFFEESAEITLYRYLKDLCQNIVLLPSLKIIENWKPNTTHYYQEQDSIVMEYEISQIDEAKLETQKLQLELPKVNFRLSLDLLKNQEQVRCTQEQIIFTDNTKIKEDVIKSWFFCILNHQDYNLSTINFEIYGPKVAKALVFNFEQSQREINNFLSQQFVEYKRNLKGSWYNIFKTQLKSNETIFNIVTDICFNTLRSALLVDTINQVQEQLIVEKFKYELQNQNLPYKEHYIQDLRGIIDQSINYIQSKFKPITYIYRNLCQKIQHDFQAIDFNPGIILQTQIYKFYAFKPIDKSEQFTKFETSQAQININNIPIIEFPKNTSIYYFFQIKSQNFFIIKNEECKIKQYLWIQNDISEIKVIFRIKEQNQLLFHYDSINSALYIFNTKLGISLIQYNEDRKIIKSEKVAHLKDNYNFIDLAYLQYYECFILLNQRNEVFKWNIDSQNIQQIDYKRPIKYQRVLTSGSGNYYSLIGENIIYIHNFNNEEIFKVDFENCFEQKNTQINQIHLFSDLQDWYFILLKENYARTFRIKNLSNQQKIVSKQQMEQTTRTSNPFLDLLKGSVIKYGPCSTILPTVLEKTQLYIHEDFKFLQFQEQKNFEHFFDYFYQLDLDSTDSLTTFHHVSIMGWDISTSRIRFNDFLFVLISRQAIQLCTIEKSLLIPLSSGLKQNKQQEIRILDKVNRLKFGVIEKLLDFNNQQEQNIFIVSIMGRQSSGKSYLLNRIFGTRFGVSSARCTDGIWMSVSKIDDNLFVLLDCEGLFSTRRTSEEETMLLAFLSSLSDITILNQDLTFSRNLNELFQNLSKTIQQIRGDKLFKGKLMIAVRDVNQKEKDAAQKELLRNIEQIKNNQHTGNFLKSLFNDNFLTMLMSYFDNKQFDKDILQIRKEFIQHSKSNKRWDEHQQLLRFMKIMLVQIEVKDHRSLEDHEIEYQIKNLQIKANELWDSMIQHEIPEIRLFDQKNAYNVLLEYSEYWINNINSTVYHNENLKLQEKTIQDILIKRSFMVINQIKQELLNNSMGEDKLKNIINDMQQQLDIKVQQYQICFEKCSECFLFCKLAKNHLKRDQIQLKEDLSKKVESLQLQIQRLSDSLKVNIDDKLEQQKIEKLEKDQQLIQLQISLKQDIIKRDNLVNDLKLLLGKDNYNDDLFACYMNEFLLCAFNLPSTDENIQSKILGIKREFQNSVSILESEIANSQEKVNQFDVQIKKINLEELYNCLNNIESKQAQLNKEIEQDQQILQQYHSNYELQIKTIENYFFNYQLILDKYTGQDISNLHQSVQHQNQLLGMRFQQIDGQIQEAIQNLKMETNKHGIVLYLLNKLEFNNGVINDIEFDVNDLQNDYSDTLKKREIFLHQKQLNKFQQKTQDLTDQIQKKEEQLKPIKQQQEQLIILYENVNQLDDQDQQMLSQQQNIFFEELFKIQHHQLYNDHQSLKVQREDLCNLLLELEQVSYFNHLKCQEDQLSTQIDDFKQCINQKLKHNQEQSQKIIRLQETISRQKKDLETLEQSKILQQNIIAKKQSYLKLAQDELGLHLENEDQLQKINSLRENINQINDQIQQQMLFIADRLLFEQNTLESLQVQDKSITVEIAQILEQIQKYNELDKLQKESDQCSNELKDIETYLSKQHNCGRQQHYCDQYCSGCIQEENPCKYLAGHDSKQGHLCTKENHFCKDKCNVKSCGKICQQKFNHDVSIQHNCLENHVCENQCAYCPKICKLSNDHQIHQCEQVQCTSLCYFNSHSFSDERKCMNQCSYLHKDKHQYHICSNQGHQCFYKCELHGTCQIATYTEILKTWQTQNGFQFQYKMYKQNAERLQCQEKLTKEEISHDTKHHCNQEHICDQRCPECDAFCTLKIGHQGKHQPHLHRNKDQQIFTFLQGSNKYQLEIQEEGLEDRVYQVGDSCEPETCTASCARRSRAHYHLVECKSYQQCAEKLNYIGKKVANHQYQKYKGSDKFYDEILCETYWDMLGWEHPVENKLRNEINLCNFYCNACIGKEKYFCTKEAWHTSSTEYKDHSFSCSDLHKIQGVDIAFVFDSTGSMQPYIQVVLETIPRLMAATKQYFQVQGKDKKGLKFSIVSYKDHDYPNVVEHIDFCNSGKALEFLNQIQIVGGKDVPEAMFDGLQTATKLQWRPNTKKFLILLCDSPPHGKPKYHQEYHDNYPEGCPCGSNEENTLPKIMGMNIQMIMLKLSQLLNQTVGSFKKTMPQMIVYEQISNNEFIKKIENLVCQQLEIREITMSKQ